MLFCCYLLLLLFVVFPLKLRVWFIAIGTTLCYGTINVKMCRIYYIFHDPQKKKRVSGEGGRDGGGRGGRGGGGERGRERGKKHVTVDVSKYIIWVLF